MEMDFNPPPKINKNKILDEMVKIAEKWWKQRNDPVLHEKFMDCCRKIGSESTEVAEFGLMFLREWAIARGYSFERVHRFLVKIHINDDIVDVKLNYFDFEYYVLVNGKVEKMFKNMNEVQPWLEERFV